MTYTGPVRKTGPKGPLAHDHPETDMDKKVDGLPVADLTKNATLNGQVNATITSTNDTERQTTSLAIDKAIAAHVAKYHATPTPTPDPTPTPTPDPIITPRPDGRVVEFIGTAAQFVTLAKDTTVGTIITSGLYKDWSGFLDVLRTAAKPLLIEGHDTIWDGANLTNSPPWRIGWSAPAGYITFDGSFLAQNYRIGKAGIIMAKAFDTLGFHGLTIGDGCYGDASIDGAKQWHSHGIYIGSNGAASPKSRNFSARGLVVEGPNVPATDPRYRMLNGVQTDGTPNCDGVVITGAKISRCYRGLFLYNSPTGVVVDGGEITDCAATIDNSGINGAAGVIKNVHALRSGPLAPGQGSWRAGQLVDGGGNIAA